MLDDPQIKQKHTNKPMSNIPTSNTAITLVALVITIIVLLILAGVTLNMVIGENGIFKKANTASENTKIENAKEIIKAAVLENEVYKKTGDTKGKSDEELLEPIKAKLTQEGYKINDTDSTIKIGETTINIPEEITKASSGGVKKEKWQILLETAEINYKRFKTLESFIDDSTEEEKNKLTQNTNAMKYLRENSDLIETLKFKDNYEKIAKYLLSTDEATNMDNYNVGLPTYVFKGNKLYLGGNWVEWKSGYGSYSFPDSNRILTYIQAINGWEYSVATENGIDISKYSTLKVYGHVNQTSKGGGNCGFGARSGCTTNSTIMVRFETNNQEKKLDLNNTNDKNPFLLDVWTNGLENSIEAYYAYIY